MFSRRFLGVRLGRYATMTQDIGLRKESWSASDMHNGRPKRPKLLGFETVSQGERVCIYRKSGRVEYVDGPARKFIWRAKIQPLNRVVATPTEYLRVMTVDGEVTHTPGPCSLFQDPIQFKEISVMEGHQLGTGTAIVVYSEAANNKLERQIIRGPALFMPKPNEWLHQFTWHGASPENRGIKIPNQLTFTELQLVPSQMYFDVQRARTQDDAVLTVQLMLFYELVDVEKMLQNSRDPIADIGSTVSADVLEFASSRTFTKFKSESELLNSVSTYKQLCEGANRIGIKISKVVFRGYAASPQLQKMHDDAIEKRTQLQLEKETVIQKQELTTLQLAKEEERQSKQLGMERMKEEHEKEVTLIRSKAELEAEDLAHAARLQRDRKDLEVSLQRTDKHQQLANGNTREVNRISLAHETETSKLQKETLEGLAAMGVDLTRYLVAKETNPEHLVQVNNTGGSSKEGVAEPTNPTRLHLHTSTK